MISSYETLTSQLNGLGFDEFYKNNISKAKYTIDYGSVKGIIESTSVLDAEQNYFYGARPGYRVSIDEQITILEASSELDDRDLLLTCIEIFDWGGVQTKNILGAFSMHREGALMDYLLNCKKWFGNIDDLSTPEFDVIWSSGWTKVYSLMFDRVTIYDSRVSAFINYVFWSFYASLKENEKQQKLRFVTEGLLSFDGATSRFRKLQKDSRKNLGLMSSPNDKKKMVANKLASWIIRYFSDLENMSNEQSSFRTIDKAAFMLGFDLIQINDKLQLNT